MKPWWFMGGRRIDRRVAFDDAEGNEVLLRQRTVKGEQRITVHWNDELSLSREHAAKLWPMLKMFAEEGKLYEVPLDAPSLGGRRSEEPQS